MANSTLGDTSQKQALRELATSSDEETRKLLAEQPGADNELLSAMLGDASEAVRFVAARRLAERGEHGAKPVLRQMVSKGSSEAVTALVLLNRLGEKSEHPQLGVVEQAALPVEKRMQLVESVQNLHPGIALPLLMQAARDPEPLVRRLVVEVASDLPGTTLKSTPGIPVLRVLANDSDAAVRARAGVSWLDWRRLGTKRLRRQRSSCRAKTHRRRAKTQHHRTKPRPNRPARCLLLPGQQRDRASWRLLCQAR